ncbi:MAG: endopeptidase La [Proteobacteria bacterium]|nr:endopeptidase La [Pseudomonadota bacterium]
MLSPPKTLPVIASRNFVLFPDRTVPLVISRPQSMKAIESAGGIGHWVIVVAEKGKHDTKGINPQNLYHYGTIAKVEKIAGNSDVGYQVTIHGQKRVLLRDVRLEEGLIFASFDEVDDIIDCDAGTRSVLVQSLKQLAHQILELVPADTRALDEMVDAIDDLELLIPICIENLDIGVSAKQEVLETLGVKARALLTLEVMAGQKQVLEVHTDIGRRLQKKVGKQQREAILREQMAAIRLELGDDLPSGSGAEGSYAERIQDSNLPEEVAKVAQDEAKRLESLGNQSPESHIIRNYLDLILGLPWNKSTEDHLDLEAARKTLNDDHYGLEKIKKRIVQHLAVMKLKKGRKGSILLFVGPPGVGKTSLGESIACALGRKFVRIALGGVRDDAEIRGHRKTYVGAMPGRIVQSLKRAGVNNPVFLLDEIDKLGRGYGGDPASALLEVLDPEQNVTFTDHFLDLPFDLSSVFFIATANSLEGIPGPLLDRMEIVELSGYTTAEKLHIAKKHLVAKQLVEHGLDPLQITVSDAALLKVIHGHTREAGVRDLQRKIQMICRWVAEKVLDGNSPVLHVDAVDINVILGSERFHHDMTERLMPAGVVTGLAWTPVGGDILFIEGTQMTGTGRLTLTGQLGDVMKESAQIALSLVRSHLGPFIKECDFDKRDIHVHVPSGAIPKDGPSAGVAMLTTLASLLTGIRVNQKLAMTGEITLRGSVTAVGGIKEKVLAAHRSGVEVLILPKRNERDYLEVPEEVRSHLKVHFVEHVSEVIEVALGMTNTFAPLALSPGGDIVDASHHSII